ncbi:hypothetical protein [Bacteroides heparinolyticus]|uniref:hypothetical protein n=1 Tax=Prevotella heparinolytica TaxID=28113 RepID=UPI0028E871AF|nr:hypothetical protein [Bacteroides heparinolyticus]
MRRHFCYLCLLFLAAACEYPVGENFIEIKEPDKEIPVKVDLNAFTNGEAILVNKPTTLDYSLSLSGKPISKIIFSLGDRIWESTSPNTQIYIDKETFPAGKYTLKAAFYAPTGSGSIADQLGAESYSGEMSWPVIIDYRMVLPDVMTYRTNENRSLELAWQTPVLSHLTVSSYTLYALTKDLRSYSETIPAGQAHFVDTRHIGKETTYKLYANMKYEGKEDLVWLMGEVTVPQKLPRLYTSAWDMEHVWVSWELPYNCLPSFTINGEEPFSPAEGQQSIRLPVVEFGTNAWYESNRVLMTLSPIDHPSETVYQKEFHAGSPGYHYEKERASSWCYNPVTGMLYAHGNFLNAYRYPQLTPAVTLEASRTATVFTSYTEPLLGIAEADKIEIRDARTLELKHTLTVSRLLLANGDLFLVPNGKLVYKTYTPDSRYQDIIIHKLDGDILSTTHVESSSALISPDGKRIAVPGFSGIRIIELDNDRPAHEYLLPIPFEKQQKMDFNPANLSQLITYDQSKHCIEIRNCRTNEVIKSILLKDGMKYLSADPVTGNLLVGNDHKLSVLSATDYKEIFTVKASYAIWPTLTGDYLTSFDGFILNIKKPSSK